VVTKEPRVEEVEEKCWRMCRDAEEAILEFRGERNAMTVTMMAVILREDDQFIGFSGS
jgi:hypothetical protein